MAPRQAAYRKTNPACPPPPSNNSQPSLLSPAYGVAKPSSLPLHSPDLSIAKSPNPRFQKVVTHPRSHPGPWRGAAVQPQSDAGLVVDTLPLETPTYHAQPIVQAVGSLPSRAMPMGAGAGARSSSSANPVHSAPCFTPGRHVPQHALVPVCWWRLQCHHQDCVDACFLSR